MAKSKSKSGGRTAGPQKLKNKTPSAKRKRAVSRKRPGEQSAANSILSGPAKDVIRDAFFHRS